MAGPLTTASGLTLIGGSGANMPLWPAAATAKCREPNSAMLWSPLRCLSSTGIDSIGVAFTCLTLWRTGIFFVKLS